jgi:hypothetical protein
MGSQPEADALRQTELRSALASADPSLRAAGLNRARPGPGVEQAVVEALADTEVDVRLAALRALVRLRGPRGTGILIEVAASDLSPAVRAEAVAAIARILDGRTLPPPTAAN